MCPKYTSIFIRGFLEGLWGSIYVEGLSFKGLQSLERGDLVSVCVLQPLGRGVFVFIALCTHLSSMKEGCLFVLFCFVLFVLMMRSSELGCFRSCSWPLWKALEEEERCIGLVSWCLDL